MPKPQTDLENSFFVFFGIQLNFVAVFRVNGISVKFLPTPNLLIPHTELFLKHLKIKCNSQKQNSFTYSLFCCI